MKPTKPYRGLEYTMFCIVALLVLCMAASATRDIRECWLCCFATFPFLSLAFIFQYKANGGNGKRRKLHWITRRTCCDIRTAALCVCFGFLMNLIMDFKKYTSAVVMMNGGVIFLAAFVLLIFGLMEVDCYE